MQKNKIVGIIQLAFAGFVIWLFFAKISPILVDNIPALALYGKVTEEHDITPSALNYNDVPVSMDAESNNRDTVRFLPHGGTKFD